MKPVFTYSALVTRVIDGDTIDATIDLGFSVFVRERFRLYGIDTPEKSSTDITVKESAYKATNFVREQIEGKAVIIECTGKDKYGRWLGKIHLSGVVSSINDQLVLLGFAKVYFGTDKTKLI